MVLKQLPKLHVLGVRPSMYAPYPCPYPCISMYGRDDDGTGPSDDRQGVQTQDSTLHLTFKEVQMMALSRALPVIQTCRVWLPSLRWNVTLTSWLVETTNDKHASANNADVITLVVWGQMAVNAPKHNNYYITFIHLYIYTVILHNNVQSCSLTNDKGDSANQMQQ